MKRACIVEVGELYDFAKNNYDIYWNHACELFNTYSIHDGCSILSSNDVNDITTVTDMDSMSDEELADRIVEEFISTLDVPEGYALMIEG
jgi:hypothetical protein